MDESEIIERILDELEKRIDDIKGGELVTFAIGMDCDWMTVIEEVCKRFNEKHKLKINAFFERGVAYFHRREHEDMVIDNFRWVLRIFTKRQITVEREDVWKEIMDEVERK